MAGTSDQLEEQPEEDERQDAGPREEDEVRAEDRGDRAGRADDRHRRARVDEDLGARRDDPADEVEERGTPSRPRRSSMLLPKIHRYSMLPPMWSQLAVQEHAADRSRELAATRASAGPASGR